MTDHVEPPVPQASPVTAAIAVAPHAPEPDPVRPVVVAAAAPANGIDDEEPKKKKRRSRKKAEPESSGIEKNLETMEWYVLKVQSNREDSISENILRRLKIAALDHYVDRIEVPIEKRLEIKDGKKKVVKSKVYPGYVILHMEMHGEAWSVIRDTGGVGHFLGAENKPLPMTGIDLERLMTRLAPQPGLEGEAAAKEAAPKPAIEFAPGDRVVIKEGPFENFEGDIADVNEAKGTVRVVVQIFGRPNPVEIEYWQVGRVRT